MGEVDVGSLHAHAGGLQHDPSGSQERAGGADVPFRDYVPYGVQHQSFEIFCWTGFEEPVQRSVHDDIDLNANIFTVTDPQESRHSIAVPAEYREFFKGELDSRFQNFKAEMGGYFDDKFSQLIGKMPARTSFQDEQHMSFKPQRSSPLPHEVFNLDGTPSSSQNFAESEPVFLSPPMVEPVGKRQSKKSQWVLPPWTMGKKKKQPVVDLSRSMATKSNEVDVEYLLNTNRLPKRCTISYLLIWKPGPEFWARMIGKYDSGYYENTHLQAWGLYLLDKRQKTSPTGRWTIMQPGFIESFSPPRKIDMHKNDGNGSIHMYPAWHTVDRVFMSINITNAHWVLGELNLNAWDLTIYDSAGPMFITQVKNRVKPLIG